VSHIDWGLARRISRLVAGPIAPTVTLPGDLQAMATDAERRVVADTGLQPAVALPAPEAVDRPRWAEINLASLRQVLDPVAERLQPKAGPLSAPLANAAGALLAAEVGGLTGLLSQRVLGQYELVLLEEATPTRLLFLAPNLLEAAGKLEADPEHLVAWVAFHEVTHAVQFTAVPWLRGHLAAMLRELLESVDVEVDWKAVARLPTRDDVEALVRAVREEGLVMVVAGRERRGLLERLQATMAVVEGHAEHVMDAVGRDALPDLDALRAALDRRRAERSAAWRLLERLLGLELKLRQYEVGKAFCDAVVERAGVERLHTVFSAPEALPTWQELQDPEAWLAR
jgi:coenzyme F420 biosynthesis associated uncharacterized protein